ncbi:MAG: histidinol-phosphatase [Rubrivivax sp.]|nr:histidinol-phosphatase [Rubrivivax sp.]
MKDLDQAIQFAKILVHVSSRPIMRHYRREFVIEKKADDSPVTIADRQAEEEMRRLIMKQYPKDGIIGEELGAYQPEADYQWVLDPIDGTKSFISGVPLFGTLIALTYRRKPILGVMHLPILKELLIGTPQQTVLNNKKVKMRECSRLSEAILLVTDHLHISQYQNGKNFDKLIKMVNFYRTWGDCFGYYLLASGFADIMLDAITAPWDSLAIIPIIQGAGGRITDYQGNEPVGGTSLIAAHPSWHQQVIEILNA